MDKVGVSWKYSMRWVLDQSYDGRSEGHEAINES